MTYPMRKRKIDLRYLFLKITSSPKSKSNRKALIVMFGQDLALALALIEALLKNLTLRMGHKRISIRQ